MQMMPQVLSDRYRLIRALGAGGFGETFLAEDTQMPSGRRCVIKQLKPIAENPQVYQLIKERFQREAAILEELGNGCSQIPKLYAYFEKDEHFYLVQEWIEGTTLSEYLQQKGILSESSVREILLSLLQVLDFVHSKRIVHRDIKPDNIILKNFDLKPVLIDFGAVKETMGTAVNSQGNSTSSIVIGTPGFMPSEQASGRPVYASDLYSLGLTAIYILTEKYPQELESDPQSGEILWRRYALKVSPTLARILDKAIQPVARDRYSTAREMLDVLMNNSAPEAAVPPTAATVISAPGNHSGSQQPTVISTPVSPVNPSPAPVNPGNSGLNDWYKAMIMGSVIGVFILAGLFINRLGSQSQPAAGSSPTPTTEALSSTPPVPQPPAQPSAQPSAQPAPSIPQQQTIPNPVPTQAPQPAPEYTPPPALISQAEAVNLVNAWLQAKQQIFAPPYNRALAGELTTDMLYSDITKPEGSIDWLVNNNALYRFGVQKIESVGQFSTHGDRATLAVEVTEDRTFYVRGKINPEQTDFTTQWRTYSLKLENGRWKIADYK